MSQDAVLRILIVDDSMDNLRMIAHTLQPCYQVQIATDGTTALELLAQEERPDLVLLDILMPGMDGFETCRRIRANADTSALPVIFLTAHDDNDKIVEGFDCGGNDYVIKPFVPVVLLARIKLQLDLLSANRRQKKLYENLKHANEELRILSNTDGLLKIANRRYFDMTFNKEWRRGIRSCQPLSLLIIDVDYFKRYNDIYGHLAGDDCLKNVAQTISRSIYRSADLVARYGGEEVAVILPNTPLDGAMNVAEAIRESLQDEHIAHKGSEISQFLTVSIGVACLVPDRNSAAAELIAAADNALYRAKGEGRNRVVSAPVPVRSTAQ